MAKRFSITQQEKKYYKTLCQSYKPVLILNHLGLISVISWWHLVLSEISLQHPLMLLSAVLLPLLLSLWGSINGSYKGAIGVCFISLFYFTSGVTHWFHPTLWPIGMSEALLGAGLFCLGLLYARWKGLSDLPIT
ncbi:DUF2069 domain-containing protein [Marinomonas atlantica]|uniref:DUF2069 domain-containing protein n=1 Tax=Marinomonas atlantica TaxID=1806668 RepID=UPI00082DC010|nr:DUF2069 domain-containing protein [Marinomonas atlantica]MCO4784461.1 DUF2069 domain-containing protein [Marinomonas atlantica]